MATYSASKASVYKALETGLQSVYCEYTVSGSLTAGDTIVMVGLPAGAMLQYLGLGGYTGDLTFSAGDSVDDDRYFSARTMTSNGLMMYATETSGFGYTYTADDQLALKLDSILSGSVAGTIRVNVMYSMDQTSND